MNDYQIVVDSTADLSEDLVRELDVKVIPFPFTINGISYKHYPDQREMAVADFYQKMDAGALPVTSQVNPSAYEDYFGELLSQGKDLVYICFASAMSGSFENALVASRTLRASFPGRKIHVVDSYCASVGEAALIYAACQMRDQGASADELLSYIIEERTQIQHYFMVEDLFHMKRGGRLRTQEKSLGSALKIKTILSVNEIGKVCIKAKVRGTKNAMQDLISRVTSDVDDSDEIIYFIGHANCRERAEQIRDELVTKKFCKKIYICDVGPVVGSHVGSGMNAIAYKKYYKG